MEMKVCFILDAGEGEGRESGLLSKGQLPLPRQAVGESFCRQREGATSRNSTVSSDAHLESGHWWPAYCHLDCFKYS